MGAIVSPFYAEHGLASAGRRYPLTTLPRRNSHDVVTEAELHAAARPVAIVVADFR